MPPREVELLVEALTEYQKEERRAMEQARKDRSPKGGGFDIGQMN